MGEFLGRWGLVAAVVWVSLSGTVGAGIWDRSWERFLAAVWVGGMNALVRGLVLRFGVVHPAGLVWELGGVLALVNAGLILSLGGGGLGLWSQSWGGEGSGLMGVGGLGGLGGSGVLGPWVCGALAFGVSWAASCVFRDHAGRWHWITYHGQVLRLQAERGRGSERGRGPQTRKGGGEPG